MKQLFYLLFMSLMFLAVGGCSDDDDKIPIEFTGTWKLITVEYPMVGNTYDFSQENVIIEIKSSGMLKVNDYTLTEEKPFFFKPNNYSIVRNQSMEHPNSWKVFTICDTTYCFDWWLHIENDTLLIDDSPLDGSKNYFVKY